MNMPLAHAFGTRVELPIPVLAFVLGGAAIVAVSFVVVLPTGVKPVEKEPPDTAAARRVSTLAGHRRPGRAGRAVLGRLRG